MNIQEYISSGILELYVYGALSDAESREVSKVLLEDDEVRTEVEEIERALQDLAMGTAPYNPEALLASIMAKLNRDQAGDKNVVQLKPTKADKRQRVLMYISLAASVILLIGVFSLLTKNNDLREQLQKSETQQVVTSSKVESAQSQMDQMQNELNQTQNLLNIFRSKQVYKIPLSGQKVAPDAYVNVFWDKANQVAYIDAQGLPAPPPGKVYQVWSLKLNPLAPTSIGLLSNFAQDQNKIFEIANPNESQGFAISLEPAGGSPTPTMDQIYTLGTVTSG